jgi:RNA polymerase sigma-70 factor (ECF subfamily)
MQDPSSSHPTLMVREIIHQLPEEQRAVLVLVCGQGLSYEAAATRLAVPLPTLVHRLLKARKAIAQSLD